MLAIIKHIKDLVFQRYAGESLVSPTLLDPIAVADGASAWVPGSYVTILAKASSPSTSVWTVNKLFVESVSASDNYQIELAYGDAGSEVVFARVRTMAAGPQIIVCPLLSTQARISARAASKTGGRTVNLSIEYTQAPLQ